jgi:D-Tyr-tRNAtyr deacylase
MRAVIQRVSKASVTVEGRTIYFSMIFLEMFL